MIQLTPTLLALYRETARIHGVVSLGRDQIDLLTRYAEQQMGYEATRPDTRQLTLPIQTYVADTLAR